MNRKRKLIWQIYPTYLLIILVALVAVTWYASDALRHFFLDQKAVDLQQRAVLLKNQFVPHLTPLVRGIHATLYAKLTKDVDLQALYEQRYAGENFVDVLPSKSHPETRSVRASNLCRIAVHRPQGGDTVVVLSVIDNLVKGASGQAVQNMNILFGFEESLGLTQIPVSP